jgi:hypothetical protein
LFDVQSFNVWLFDVKSFNIQLSGI